MGFAPRTMPIVFGIECVPQSVAFFCNECGTLWAVASVPNSSYTLRQVLCEKHDHHHWRTISGSIWSDDDRLYREALPPEVIKREFELMLKLYEKEESHDNL